MKIGKKKIIIGIILCIGLGFVILAFFSMRKTSIGNVLSEKQGVNSFHAILGARDYGSGQISVNEAGIFLSTVRVSYLIMIMKHKRNTFSVIHHNAATMRMNATPIWGIWSSTADTRISNLNMTKRRRKY